MVDRSTTMKEQLTVLLQDLAFALSDTLNPPSLNLAGGAEKALPAGYGIGTDQRAVE